MGKRRYNATAARDRGEMTIGELETPTWDALLHLRRKGQIDRNNTGKRYWMPGTLAELLGVESIEPPEGARADRVLVPVDAALASLEKHVSDLRQVQPELGPREIGAAILTELQINTVNADA
jgi:hypothetical protein